MFLDCFCTVSDVFGLFCIRGFAALFFVFFGLANVVIVVFVVIVVGGAPPSSSPLKKIASIQNTLIIVPGYTPLRYC